MSALAACGGKRQGGRQWLTEHFRLQGTAVLKENSDDLHLIAEKPGASAARAGQRHRRAPAPLGCHLQRAAAICSALPQTHRKLIFWQNTGINMTFKQVVLSQAEHGCRAKLKLHTCHVQEQGFIFKRSQLLFFSLSTPPPQLPPPSLLINKQTQRGEVCSQVHEPTTRALVCLQIKTILRGRKNRVRACPMTVMRSPDHQTDDKCSGMLTEQIQIMNAVGHRSQTVK